MKLNTIEQNGTEKTKRNGTNKYEKNRDKQS